MKKLLLLLFIPLVSFGQEDVKITVKKEKSFSESFNDGLKAGAAVKSANAQASKARAAASAAMNESSVNVIVPLKVDVNNYNQIALVGITYAISTSGAKVSGKSQYANFANLFLNSPLTLINPYKLDRKRARKNNRFLREIKDPKTLYVYYDTSMVGVNSHRMLIVRDYQNKIIYRAKAINIDKAELVDPFVYF